MSSFRKVAKLSDIEPQGLKVEIDGEEILLVKDGGAVYALSNICTHQEQELCGGFAEEGSWVCPHHGARFEIKTGTALCMPAVEDLKTYEVKINGEEVFVEVKD